MTNLRVVFMGTPDFAVPALQALAIAGHDIAAVYCQPPKPSGRGHQIRKSPVHLAAETLGLSVYTPLTLREDPTQKEFESHRADVAIVAAYGLILPLPILKAPHMGCLNIHASLLPRWRGAAPIQRALMAGDQETGITIMRMDQGLDTGDMLRQSKVTITPTTTAGSLHDTLMALGSQLLIPTLKDYVDGQVLPVPQPLEGVTYAAKLTREDGQIDWHKTAEEIERQIRGLQPWPGCSFLLNSESIKVHNATIVDKTADAGTLLDHDLTIACGHKALRLDLVQRAGKKPMDGASFLRGQRVKVGHRL